MIMNKKVIAVVSVFIVRRLLLFYKKSSTNKNISETLENFDKVLRVFDTLETLEQFENALKYCALFLKKHKISKEMKKDLESKIDLAEIQIKMSK